MSAVEIRHEGFVGESVVRERNGQSVCAQCGRKGRTFRYGIRRDADLSGYVQWYAHAYCSIGCMRDFQPQ